MLKTDLADWLLRAVRAAQASGRLPAVEITAVPVERARRRQHGEYATSLPLQLAGPLGWPPRKIAQAIVDHLPPAEFAEQVTIAGAGFVNVALRQDWLAQQVNAIVEAPKWGGLDLGQGQAALVEFVSANPTGPLHVGRAWGAVLGDTLARVLQHAGYQVTREYYFNNAGRQMRLLGESVRARYLQLLGRPAPLPSAAEQEMGTASLQPGSARPVPFPDEGYQGEYIAAIAQAIAAEAGSGWAEAGWVPFKERAEAWLRADIGQTLERLGVRFDAWFNEQDLYASGALDRTVSALRERGAAYDAEGAVWLRATAWGAGKDRVLVRSNGEPTYRLPDIAYHLAKLERGFDLVVNVLGIDHQDEFPDVVNALRALELPAERVRALRVLFHQFITLVRHGQPARMSTRRANYVTLDDLLDAVTRTHPESGITLPGSDSVRFMLLARGPGSPMQFDLDLVMRQSSDNPVYYVQYAHARLAGILRKAGETGWEDWRAGDPTVLVPLHPAELDVIWRMLELPEVVERVVEELAPHYLAQYAQDLAAEVHAFYRDCPVIAASAAAEAGPQAAAQTRARLKLVAAARRVLAETLGLMGVSAPERM